LITFVTLKYVRLSIGLLSKCSSTETARAEWKSEGERERERERVS